MHGGLDRVLGTCGVLGILLLSPASGGAEERLFRESAVVMGTVVQITVADDSEELARAAIREALAEFIRIDELLGDIKPGSVVSAVNRQAALAPVQVGEEVFSLLRQAISFSEASRGAFDITIGPVSRSWSFDRDPVVPQANDLRERLLMVGYKNLILNNSKLSVGFAVSGMAVELGAIGKGWAVDSAIRKLSARGIRNAIVDAGGDLRAIGGRPGKGSWRIGIQHPRNPGTLLATLDVRDTAIVTSGDYERFFVADGVRYHHILDPATGLPARGCQSVTVLAPTAAEADACATAAFVLGPQNGLAFLRARPGVRGLIVGAGGDLHWTDEELARMAGR